MRVGAGIWDVRRAMLVAVALGVGSCASAASDTPIGTLPAPVSTAQVPTPTAQPEQTAAQTVDPLAADDASVHAWRRSNPGGGGAFSSAAAAGDGASVLAGSDLSGLARTTDGGNSWEVVGAASGLTDTHVSALAFDPTDTEVAFVGTDGGLFRSTDTGASFRRLDVFGYVSAVAPIAPVVYVGVQPEFDSNQGSVLRSADGGESFVDVGQVAPGRYLLALRADPAAPQRILALTGDGRFASSPSEVYLSTDSGDTWTQLRPGGAVIDAQFDVHNSETIWLTTDGGESEPGGLWKQAGRGGDWELVANHGGVLWLPRDQPGTIRLVEPRFQFPWDDRSGTWESVDSGETFIKVGSVEAWSTGWSEAFFAYGESFNGIVPTLGFDREDGDHAVWVNGQWIFETTDGGRTFEQIFATEISSDNWQSRGFDNVVVADIAASADPNILYVGYWDLGCFRSTDAGGSWQNCNTLEHSGDWDRYGGFTGTVVADPTRPRVVWAAHSPNWEAPGVVLRSADAAEPQSWRETSGLPPAANILGLSVDPTSPTEERILYVTVDGDVYRSKDDGWTWALDFECGGCRTTYVSPSGAAFAGGEPGLFERADGEWLDVGGDTMTGATAGPPWAFEWAGVAAITGDSDSGLWVAVTGLGVFNSDDGGATWVLRLDDPFVRDVSARPGVTGGGGDGFGDIWVASSSAVQAGGFDETSQGLRRSTDGGQTWETIDAGLEWPFVSHVVVAQSSVLAASPGAGVVIGTSLLPDEP